MRKWENEKTRYLIQNFHKKSIPEIAAAIGKTDAAVKTKALKLGLKRNNKHIWTEKEISYLKANYENERIELLCNHLGLTVGQIYHKANFLGLKKSKELIAQMAKENISSSFLSHSKRKGDIPHNKGIQMSVDVYERVKHTMFKKGNKPPNTKENGFLSTRNSKGFKSIYVRIELSKWIPLSRYLWEQEYGTIPQGHVVSFIDGNWQNCTLENLKLLSRAENMERNSFHRYPKEIRKLISLRAVISRKINKFSKWKTKLAQQ
jgi:hypothetical protein